jgi:FixJ family two-component response regulator
MYTGIHSYQQSHWKKEAKAETPIVAIVSDDIAAREALNDKIFEQGWQLLHYESVNEFLDRAEADVPGCVVFDAHIPDLTGLHLTHLICSNIVCSPMIFLTGDDHTSLTVNAAKYRVAFLPKTFDTDSLLREVKSAIQSTLEASRLDDCYQSLSRRERQVMKFVVDGLMNKQVAFQLSISEITVKAHRGQVMRKMNARTLPDLVNMAARLKAGSTAYLQ